MSPKPESPFPPLWVTNELLALPVPLVRPGHRLRAEVTITQEPETATPPHDCTEYILVPKPLGERGVP